jgi:hypothetical protein
MNPPTFHTEFTVPGRLATNDMMVLIREYGDRIEVTVKDNSGGDKDVGLNMELKNSVTTGHFHQMARYVGTILERFGGTAYFVSDWETVCKNMAYAAMHEYREARFL